jgi:hypothetical protein
MSANYMQEVNFLVADTGNDNGCVVVQDAGLPSTVDAPLMRRFHNVSIKGSLIAGALSTPTSRQFS